MENEDEDGWQAWTGAGAKEFQEAARELASVVVAHSEQLVSHAGAEPSVTTIDSINQKLRKALQLFGDALFQYTGSFDPVTNLYPEDYFNDEGLVDHDQVAVLDGQLLTVIERTDYLVTSKDELLHAAGEAERRHSLGATDPTSAEILTIEAALYAISHEAQTGWRALRDSPGLMPVAAAVVVKAIDDETSLLTDGIPFQNSMNLDVGNLPTLFSFDERF